jgi:hypothetical protein
MADYPITAVDRRVVYSGSAGTGPYNFSFPVLAATDLDVYKDTTKLTLTTDYSVTISASDGTGSVTLGSAASGDNTVTIVGARAIQRTTDFVTAGDLLASSLNTELDSQTIFVQQASEDATRAIKAPVTDPTSIDMTLPVKASRLGKLLGFDSSTGNPEATTGRVLSATASDVSPGGSATASFDDSTGVLTLGIPTGATGATGTGIDVLTTRGDIVIRNASNATARLAVGGANTVLKSDGSDVAYGTIATANIADDAVTSAKIADDAITSALIADDAVVAAAIADNAVATAMIQDDAVSLAKMASGTDGNLITYDASGNPAHVATGSSGQVLTSNGSGSAPTFQAAAAGGKVLQIVTAATSTEATSTSGTYADTNLTADITPANTANKILVLVSQSISSTGGRAGGALRILRGTTEIEEYNQISNAENQMGQHFIQHLDSPSSTSSTTYHTEFKRIDQSANVVAQRNDASGNATSTITLIELDYS